MKISFSHDIFQGNNPPTFTGQVTFNLVRTKMYCFPDGDTLSETQLRSFLAKADPEKGLEEVEPDNDFEFRHRLSMAMLHDELKEDGEQVKVEVTLLPGASFSYGYSFPTEEGYHSYSIEAYWTVEGWEVEEVSGGRDCDGQLENTTKYREEVNGDQSKAKTVVYDQFAQLAGY